jgi:hypothetical protein
MIYIVDEFNGVLAFKLNKTSSQLEFFPTYSLYLHRIQRIGVWYQTMVVSFYDKELDYYVMELNHLKHGTDLHS